ncbi:MAG: putative metal-dependent hydrolase [Bacteroidetes bacterium]|nr:putative metal-dependent hydrolase [Bacteroidota bacterium]
MNNDLKYPIGKYEVQPFSNKQKEDWLLDIKFLPSELELSVQNFDELQLQTPYRDDGWTVHQLVHHIADSHINAYIRFKLCLTEDSPTIKTYDQDAWAELDDTKNLPINISLTLLHALHQRWYVTIKDLPDEAWNRTVYHTEQKKQITLWDLLGMYSWHCKHHVAHINNLKEKMGWHL